MLSLPTFAQHSHHDFAFDELQTVTRLWAGKNPFQHRVSLHYSASHVTAFHLGWKQHPYTLREPAHRVLEEHGVENPLHSVTAFLEPRQCIGIPFWRVSYSNVIGKQRIECGVVQANDFLVVNTDAFPAYRLRQVNPKAPEEPAATVKPSKRELTT